MSTNTGDRTVLVCPATTNRSALSVQIHKIGQSRRRHLSPTVFYPKAVTNVTESAATITLYTQINGSPSILLD